VKAQHDLQTGPCAGIRRFFRRTFALRRPLAPDVSPPGRPGTHFPTTCLARALPPRAGSPRPLVEYLRQGHGKRPYKGIDDVYKDAEVSALRNDPRVYRVEWPHGRWGFQSKKLKFTIFNKKVRNFLVGLGF